MPASTRIRCPKCNYPNRSDSERCASCGLPLFQTCPTCGTRRPWHVQDCPRCHREADDGDLFLRLFREPPPKTLRDRYAIQQELARGRATAVYLAKDLAQDGEAVVVKAFSEQNLLTSEERSLAADTFHQTVARWAALDHPAPPRILGTFAQTRHHYLVMEHVPGHSLEVLIQDPAYIIREETALNWMVQLCDLLTYLHGQDPPLVFADLKPGHLMMEPSGKLRALGWNLDRLFLPWEGRDPRHLGTPGYEAPEQRKGMATPASDVHAAGRILYALLTRQLLVPGKRLRPLRQVSPSVSPQTERAVVEACRPDPKSRTPTAAAFKKALLEGREVAPAEALAPPEELVAYRFSTTQRARNLEELVRLCQRDWEQARRQFFAREVSRWLKAQAEQLRRSLQAQEAERLAHLADSADRARQETAQAAPVAQDIAFARWLQSTGYVVGRPAMQVSTRYLKLGTVPPDRKLKVSFEVQNTGNVYLMGRLTSQVPWLRPLDADFGCPPDGSVRLSLLVLGDRLPPQGERNPQVLLLESNAGRLWIGAQAAPPKGELTVSPQELDFGTVGPGQEEAVAAFRVTNPGGQAVQAQVRTAVPWLTVTPERFTCPRQGSLEVQVRLEAAHVPAGARVEPNALLIDSDAGQASLSARWDLQRPVLEVSPSALQFGAVAQGTASVVILHVANRGTGRLVGKAMPRSLALSVSPETFACEPGEVVDVRVCLATEELPLGRTGLKEAVQVVSNGGQKALPMNVEVQGAHLEVDPPWLHFGAILPGDTCDLTLHVSNRGVLPLVGRAVPLVAWLRAEPGEFRVASGETSELRVWTETGGFDRGVTLSEPQALQVVSNGGDAVLGAGITLLVPELAVSPTSVDFGPVAREETGERRLTIANRGTGVLEWQAITGETWLEVVPERGTLGPNRQEEITLRAYPLGLPLEARSGHGTLQVASNGGHVFVEVTLSVAVPRLFLGTPNLDLGTSDNYAPLHERVQLFNRGTGTLRGKVVSSVPWMVVEPAEFACETGMSTSLSIAVNPVGLPPDVEHVGVLVLESNGGSEQATVRFRVAAHPCLEVQPGEVHLQPDGETGQLAGEVRIRNAGFGVMDVSIRANVPWLSVPRASYRVRRGRPVRVPLTTAPEAPATGRATLAVATESERVEIPVHLGG